MDLNYQIDLCLEKTCWVVDILPRQVEKDSSASILLWRPAGVSRSVWQSCTAGLPTCC